MSGLLPVDDALAMILDGAATLPGESVLLADAGGRVLAEDVIAARAHPPFDASAMDGYAVREADLANVPVRLAVIGRSVAGRRFDGPVRAGEAVRIFTGAALPHGADTILIQENATALGDAVVEAHESVAAGRHIRKAGLDFTIGDVVLPAGRKLDAAALSLAAAANHPRLSVVRQPVVAILATGDELVPPGSQPTPDQIIASNTYGIAMLAREAGGRVLDLGIVLDNLDAISAAVERAGDEGADVIVTIGGASVGDHDLVARALTAQGMVPGFWKIAMRPGKPLMFGKIGATRVLALPGNPASSLVCALLFLQPLVARLAGLPYMPDLRDAVLGEAMEANGNRRDYVRAVVEVQERQLVATPLQPQDSSMLTAMAKANALIVREPLAFSADAGSPCKVFMLR